MAYQPHIGVAGAHAHVVEIGTVDVVVQRLAQELHAVLVDAAHLLERGVRVVEALGGGKFGRLLHAAIVK